MTKTHGVIVGAVAHEENVYDGDALRPALEQTRAITDQQPAKAILDRGYRGRKAVDGTEVLLPGKPRPGQSKRESAKMWARFRRRAAIEPVISLLNIPVSADALLLERLCRRPDKPAPGGSRVELEEVAADGGSFLPSTLSTPSKTTNPRPFSSPSVKEFFRSD